MLQFFLILGILPAAAPAGGQVVNLLSENPIPIIRGTALQAPKWRPDMNVDKKKCQGKKPIGHWAGLCFLVIAVLFGASGTYAADILLVYGEGKFNQGDNLVSAHLLKSRYLVTLRSDRDVAIQDADGMDLVIISDSVDTNLLGAMFREVQVPVLCSEHQQLDDLGMTDLNYGADFGKALNRQTIKITDPDHTLAANLNGTVLVSNKGFAMGWGVPGESAVCVGALEGLEADAGKRYGLFSYEFGDEMPGLTAPAKRVGLFLSSKVWKHLTPNGKKLFDVAVDHSLRASAGGCAPCQSREHLVTFTNHSGENIWVGVWDAVKNKGIAPPSDFTDWELGTDEEAKTKTFCAPYGANYRFLPRGGCKDGNGEWKIRCDSNDCNWGGAQATCANGGLQSLAEINFDNQPNFQKDAYYDVSYVDGFNYAVAVAVTNADGCKDLKAGCKELPACPWPTRDGDGKIGGNVCWGACKEIWARANLDGLPENQRPTSAQISAVCCQCKVSCDDVGCDNVGCGCSPYAFYSPLRTARTCCSPIPDLEPNKYACAENHCTWPEIYKSYPKDVKTICTDSYVWQYNDGSALMHCSAGTQPFNFSVEFWPR